MSLVGLCLVCYSPQGGWLTFLRSNVVRREFPLQAPYSRQVLPLVVGFPHLRVLRLISLPICFRRAFSLTILLRLPAQLSVTLLRFRLGPVSGFPLPCLNIRIPSLVPSHWQEPMGPPKFLCASLPACHGLWTPADLPILALTDVLVLPSADVKPLGIRNYSFRSCTSSSGCAVTPTAYRILCLRFVHLLFAIFILLLRNGRKTRYGWLAKPYPTGTFTLQDTPSFLGAITIEINRKGRAISGSASFLYHSCSLLFTHGFIPILTE